MDEINFTQSAVAFLDILGFKSFIEAAERPDSPEFAIFCELLEVARRQLDFNQTDGGKNAANEQHRFPKDVGLRVLHVSDSFILSAPLSQRALIEYSGFAAVSMKAIQLAHQLLKMGFLVRGGIAVGNVYHTELNIFGTAYQAAYKTQEECANMPRVILHQSAVDYFEENQHRGRPLRGWSIFAQEGDMLMLDTMNSHPSYLGDDPTVDPVERFESYKAVIEKKLAQLPPGRYREKWEWTAAFFNAKTQRFSQLKSVGPIEVYAPQRFRFGPLID